MDTTAFLEPIAAAVTTTITTGLPLPSAAANDSAYVCAAFNPRGQTVLMTDMGVAFIITFAFFVVLLVGIVFMFAYREWRGNRANSKDLMNHLGGIERSIDLLTSDVTKFARGTGVNTSRERIGNPLENFEIDDEGT